MSAVRSLLRSASSSPSPSSPTQTQPSPVGSAKELSLRQAKRFLQELPKFRGKRLGTSAEEIEML